jgi:hypothetical protein
MDEWQPDRTLETAGTVLYLWIIPAQVAGTWTWTMPGVATASTLHLTQEYQHVHGTLQTHGSAIPLTDVALIGDRLRFSAVAQQQGQPVRLQFEAQVEGNTMISHVTTHGATGDPQRSWVIAQRLAAN